MSRYGHVVKALTGLFSAVIGSLVSFAVFALPAAAQDPAPDGNGPLVGSTSTSSGGLEWWAILLIVVGGIAVIAALAEFTRFEIRHHRRVTHPAM